MSCEMQQPSILARLPSISADQRPAAPRGIGPGYGSRSLKELGTASGERLSKQGPIRSFLSRPFAEPWPERAVAESAAIDPLLSRRLVTYWALGGRPRLELTDNAQGADLVAVQMMEQIATSCDAVAAMMRDAKITVCPSGSPHTSVILPPPRPA